MGVSRPRDLPISVLPTVIGPPELWTQTSLVFSGKPQIISDDTSPTFLKLKNVKGLGPFSRKEEDEQQEGMEC